MMPTQSQHIRRIGEPHLGEGKSEADPVGNDERNGDEDATSSALSRDEAFDVLRNSRRRAVLSCLRAQGRIVSVEELTMHVAADEHDIPASDIGYEQYKRVYTGLYQCHLRRMDDLGVIDFDSDQNTVRLRKAASSLEPYLESRRNPIYARGELAIASAMAILVSLGTLGIGPLGGLSQTSLATVTVVALFGLVLFQLVRPYSNSIIRAWDRTTGLESGYQSKKQIR